MPMFYLHLYNVHIEARDYEGQDLPDLDAARAKAIDGVRDFIGHEAQKGLLDLRGRMEITDAGEVVVATIPFADAFTFHGYPQGG